MRLRFLIPVAAILAAPAWSQTLQVESAPVIEWKAVFGQVETRDRVPARVRIGGTIAALTVTEGDRVEAGQSIASVEDDKLAFQLDSIDARLEALGAQLDTATTDLERGRTLLDRGVITKQRFDMLQTNVDVIAAETRSLQSQRLVTEQQVAEGEVLAPEAGVVLSVPISLGSVVIPGEPVAIIGGGGVFLRLAVPERHARNLEEGNEIEIGTGAVGAELRETGRLVKLYPQITAGRVQADVEVEGLEGRFVGRRIPVRLPVGERMAILVPQSALSRSGGLDFVTVEIAPGETVNRVVVPGGSVRNADETWREILTGLTAGETLVLNDE